MSLSVLWTTRPSGLNKKMLPFKTDFLFFVVSKLVPFNMLTVQFVFWLLCCSIPAVRKSSVFLSKNPGHGKIVGVGSVESSFLYQTTRCINSFDHPDLAPIMVFLECLTTLEVSYLVLKILLSQKVFIIIMNRNDFAYRSPRKAKQKVGKSGTHKVKHTHKY